MPHPIKFAQIKAVATWFEDIPELRRFAETGEYEEAMLVIERIIDRGFSRQKPGSFALVAAIPCRVLEIGIEFHPDFGNRSNFLSQRKKSCARVGDEFPFDASRSKDARVPVSAAFCAPCVRVRIFRSSLA